MRLAEQLEAVVEIARRAVGRGERRAQRRRAALELMEGLELSLEGLDRRRGGGVVALGAARIRSSPSPSGVPA